MKREKADKKIVIVFLGLVLLAAICFCVIVYFNRVRALHFDLDHFLVDETEQIAKIMKISKNEKYLQVEGQYIKPLKMYRIYIGIENADGEMKLYRTEVKNREAQVFWALIRDDGSFSEDDKISIIWMCDKENIIIKTDRMVGEAYNE